MCLVSAVCCEVGVSVTADRSFRGVLPSVVRLSMISKPRQYGGPDPLGLSSHKGGGGLFISKKCTKVLAQNSY